MLKKKTKKPKPFARTELYETFQGYPTSLLYCGDVVVAELGTPKARRLARKINAAAEQWYQERKIEK